LFEMEHLDLAEYIASAHACWNSLGSFEQHDVYLSNSRQALEPIIEETSEDEEHAQKGSMSLHKEDSSFSSSTKCESCTVICIEVTRDIDTISERDFFCPPKRQRRCQEADQPQNVDEIVQLCRPLQHDVGSHSSLERFLAMEASTRDSIGSHGQRSSTGSRRVGIFEDYYSENDSYHSLSRSSSLVQFESLERQLVLQEQHQSLNNLGNSSPSLLNCELGAATRVSDSNPEIGRASASSLSLLKRYESNDGRLHQTYYELNKLIFEEQRDLFPKKIHQAELKSGSESSSSSSCDISGHSLLNLCQSNGGPGEPENPDGASSRRLPLNSAENLSEDSGYCETRTLRRENSKSIPKNFDKLCEEEEEQLLLEDCAPNSSHSIGEHDLCQPKIEQPADTATMPCSPSSSSINSAPERTVFQLVLGSPLTSASVPPSASPLSLPSPTGSTASSSSSSAVSFTWQRNSLPDVCEPRGSPFPSHLPVIVGWGCPNETQVEGLATSSNPCCSQSSSSSSSPEHSAPLGISNSLPNGLQQLGRRRRSRHSRSIQNRWHSHSGGSSSSEEWKPEERRDDFFINYHSLSKIRQSCSWNKRARINQHPDRIESAVGSAGYLNDSYQNLTLLDYTDHQSTREKLQTNNKRNQVIEMSETSSIAAGDYEQVICQGNFLLDEISKIYDKKVSILNDKPVYEDRPSQSIVDKNTQAPEEVPQVQHVQLTIRKPPARQKRLVIDIPNQHLSMHPVEQTFSSYGKTFDQDPTNLRTTYAQSLEHCTCELQEVVTDNPMASATKRSLPKRRFQAKVAAAKQCSLVSSTPNLSAYNKKHQEPEGEIYLSSAHTSMHQLPHTPTQPKPLGILLSAGSRNSFNKEVSFCPVVSKYCWHEQSCEEPQEKQGQTFEGKQGLLSDDELLDNANASVIHSTKENEIISAIFGKKLMQKRTESLNKGLSEPALTAEESTEKYEIITNDTIPEVKRMPEIESDSGHKHEHEPASSMVKSRVVANSSHSSSQLPSPSNSPKLATPVSIPARPLSLHLPILSQPPTNRAHHILYASQHLLQRCDPEDQMLPSSKTIGKTDEKHPSSKGFLSRFAHGLRISLLRKNKHKQQDRKMEQPTFFEPAPGKPTEQIHRNINERKEWKARSSQCVQLDEQLTKTFTLQKVVSGKPPLPKQPPKSGSLAHAPRGTHGGVTNAAHASEALLSAEREQYQQFADQLGSGTHATRMRDTNSPSRVTVSQKMQMINQLGVNEHGTRPTMVTVVPVAVSPVNDGCKMGLIETNLDTHETVISGRTRSLVDITSNAHHLLHKRYIVKRQNVSSATYEPDDLNTDKVKTSPSRKGIHIVSVRRPHKSMEFLLDKENQKIVLPPENELQKSHDYNPATLSEHQLRVQASLQRLNIPEWFRQYNHGAAVAPEGAAGATDGYRPGNFTRKRTQESGRWQGLNSKTTSLSSLGSQRTDRSPLMLSPSSHSHYGDQNTYTESSAVVHGAAHNQSGTGATRWSTSHLNSSQTSPSVSQRGSFSRATPTNSSFMSVASTSGVLRNTYRQPYMGWRSSEKLSQRTPHERLASSLLPHRPTPAPMSVSNGIQNIQHVTSDIQSSIKEVTSAIVHYVNDQQQQSQQQRSRSASPNFRKCWLESSFVGMRPVDSPQTPIIDSSQSTSAHSHHTQKLHALKTNMDISLSTLPGIAHPPLRINVLSRFGASGAPERSLSSASLEDVLASLLGLPTTSSSSPNCYYNSNIQLATATREIPTLHQLNALTATDQQQHRRRSEGDTPQQTNNLTHGVPGQQSLSFGLNTIIQLKTSTEIRRVFLSDSTPMNLQPVKESGSQINWESGSLLRIACRNTKCDQSALPADVKKIFKSCHNCSHLYCSRECRRSHWEKHRKACLHSRVSNLCRHVLATCKDDHDCQRHLSLLARKGSISQGRGVVRVLFRSALAAEGFIQNGFQCMGEASYVRWPDLMPAEMGLELYSELLKLSTEYKPESKMLIYVAICVVSEAPGMGQAPVRWERQLVSRCAKLKLCKTVLVELEQQKTLHQQISVAAVPEHTDILILTFNPGQRTLHGNRELVLSNILDILSRRGVILRKHYPEIFQRLQTYIEGHSDKFNPVTLHPRDSQTGKSFVCIIMPVHTDFEFIKLPSAADGRNRVTTIDVGSPTAFAKLDDDELLTRTSPAS
ncbi:hypothetical protein KR009_002632, partial [Drosophila setifemur]